MKNRLRYFLTGFLILSALFDLYTTVSHKNFIAFESNPTFLFSGGIILLAICKIIVMLFLIYLLWVRTNKRADVYNFFYIYLILTLCVYQSYAGVSNIQLKKDIIDTVNYDTGHNYTVNDVPAAEVAKLIPKKESQMQYYLNFVGVSIVFPAILALSSFVIFQRLKRDDIV